jgi:hypothetical protein
VPDWDSTESRESDEDAAWRDLVARFAAPLAAEHPVPWPTVEDVPAEAQEPAETGGVNGAGRAGEADGKHRGPEADGLGGEQERHAADGERGRHAGDGEPGRHAADGNRAPDGLNGERRPAGPGDEPGETRDKTASQNGRREPGSGNDPEVIQVPRTIRGPVRDDDEHYIPPPPPPLPKLDPMAKGAWVALFGGPGYLVVATAAGWTITGLAAFCAVAAFVAGFVILVLRLHESGPGGPNDGDDGAVV